jgi:hypothetical protein
MLATELLIGLLDELQRQVRVRVGHLSAVELAWRPDPGGNPVGVTVWHFSRWLDFLGVCMLGAQPQDQQHWFVNGWAERMGYDPRGLGIYGYGVLTGYTIEEVNEVPAFSAEQLLTYLSEVCAGLRDQILPLASDQLNDLAPSTVHTEPDGTSFQRSQSVADEDEEGPLTRLEAITGILTGSFRHTGEIDALLAIRSRLAATSGTSTRV